MDLTEPHMWYPLARDLKRKVICHVGPTNSGKTHSALAALAEAKTGIYCGPLRLLAWEVSDKLLSKKVACGLLTGQESVFPDPHTHVSCTIEMANTKQYFECAVIDEAQMIGDDSRGWAWTNAFLGLHAPEIHLCGSPSMLPVIKKLCERTEDLLTVKTYKRLSPLIVQDKCLGSYRNIKKGDCVVGFSRKSLYEIKVEIEKNSKERLKCCVIYGNLPPETRQGQAKLFNSRDSEFDVLVATDAIGMGLNLQIKRVVFSTVEKFDGSCTRILETSEIKQIAGRAGRFGGDYEVGYVTCLEDFDIGVIRDSAVAEDDPITRAGLSPSLEQLELLGILMDYQLDKRTLSSFWKRMFETNFSSSRAYSSTMDFDLSSEEVQSSPSDLNLEYATIIKFFGSIREFVHVLEDHLLFHSSSSRAKIVKRVRRSRALAQLHGDDSIEKGGRYLPYRRQVMPREDSAEVDGTEDDDDTGKFSTGELQEMAQKALDSPLPSYHFDEYSFQQDSLSDRAEERDDGMEEVDNYAGPLTQLSVLLRVFHRTAELDSSGLYFICDLKEKLLLALALDDIELRFRDRFVFCLAPVDTNSPMVLQSFKRFAFHFSSSGKVYLDKKTSKVIELVRNKTYTAKTPEDLLKLENVHKVLDLYLWLGQRFPDNFTEIEEVALGSKACALLVDSALRTLGAHKKRIRKHTNRQTQK